MENELIKRQVGNVSISKDTFTDEQIETYNKVLTVLDTNPKLVWDKKDPDHNTDLCVIGEGIEPTRNFALKVIKCARYGVQVVNQSVTHNDGEAYVLVTVRVFSVGNPGDFQEGSGACSTKETKRKGSKRTFHDAVGIAETRAMKRAIEMKFGVAIFNMIIKELFGGYNIKTGTQEEERAEYSQRNIDLARQMRGQLNKAIESGHINKSEYDGWIGRIKANLGNYGMLEEIQKGINDQMSVRVKNGNKSN